MDQHTAADELRNHGWLAGETDRVTNAVLAGSKLRHYKAGETAFRSDDEPGGIYGIADGSFGIYLPSGRGETVLCTIIRRGIWFGHGPVLTGKGRTMTFRALEPSCALYLPLTAISAIVADYPDFTRRLGALSERNYTEVALRVISDLMMPSVERRIAATLVRISPREAQIGTHHSPPKPIRVTQTEIGQMANASRDSVNRALSRFARAGWLSVEFKTLRIFDLDALDDFATGA